MQRLDQSDAPVGSSENQQGSQNHASSSDGTGAKINGASAESLRRSPSQPISDTEERLAELARERDSLRAEVVELRKSLEGIQEKHRAETLGLREDLNTTQSGKEVAETQYRNLLGKVNTIKSQLGERLKADAVCVSTSDRSFIAYASIGRPFSCTGAYRRA